jgi:FkbM family methyltransferase
VNILRALKPVVEKIPGAAGYYRYTRDSLILKDRVKYRDELGFYFNGSSSMEKGIFEPQETEIIESLLGSFDLFINIGANVGYYVCKALNRGVPTIAFEPNQLNVNVLLKNIASNAFPATFQLFPVALSDQLGVTSMYGASTGASLIKGWAGQEDSYLVPVSTFDLTAKGLIDGKSCLFLIDIEGAELGCLKGASATLASSKCSAFLIEISIGGHQPTGTKINPNLIETFALMESYGFEAYTADTRLRKIDLSEISRIHATSIDSIGTHNFLFVRDSEIVRQIKFK